MTEDRPNRAFNFALEIRGVPIAAFQEVTGLGGERPDVMIRMMDVVLVGDGGADGRPPPRDARSVASSRVVSRVPSRGIAPPVCVNRGGILEAPGMAP